jgi:hypothetical protein
LIGGQAGDALTDTDFNVAVGTAALGSDTQGERSTALGYGALSVQNFSTATITYNTSIGYLSGERVTTGAQNTLIGYAAGSDLTDADFNVVVGTNALVTDTLGHKTTAIGTQALATQNFSTSTNSHNTAMGYQVGLLITTGLRNVLIGSLTGDALTDADDNVAVGQGALGADTLGSRSTAIGKDALADQNFTSATDANNVAVGYHTGKSISTGVQNTLVGNNAGDAFTTGVQNTILGYNTDTSGAGGDNRIGIGVSLSLTTNSQIKIGNASTFIENTWGSNATWSHSSDERLKENIQDATLGLSFINDLRTVNYNWRLQKDVPEELRNDNGYEKETEIRQHGLVAQEVKAALDKAGVDTFLGWSEGQDGVQMISESMFVFPLIKAVQELSTQVTALQAEVEKLKSGG